MPAKPDGSALWTLAVEWLTGPAYLKISVKDSSKTTWHYSETNACCADGDTTSLVLPDHCLCPDGPVGALVAKIGGSTAGAKDGTLFLVGGHCIFKVAEPGGPLYLTINDEKSGMENNAGMLTVEICSAPIPADAATPT